jgi:hypothetical protein
VEVNSWWDTGVTSFLIGAFFVLLAIAALGAVGIWSTGRVGVPPRADVDQRPVSLEARPSFDVVVRGYNMEQVDRVVAELQAELERRPGV